MRVSPALGLWMTTRGLGPVIAVAAVAIALASASWFAFERPLNGLKQYFPYRPVRRPRMAEAAA